MKQQMTPEAAARIQSSIARKNGGKIPSDSFAARAQRAATKSAAKGDGGWPSTTGKKSGGGRTNNPPKGAAKGPGGWPSTTGKPSGGGRNINPPKGAAKGPGGKPSKKPGKPSGGGRDNNPPSK